MLLIASLRLPCDPPYLACLFGGHSASQGLKTERLHERTPRYSLCKTATCRVVNWMKWDESTSGVGRTKVLSCFMNYPQTHKPLEKEAARELVRQMVTDRLGSLVAAQMDNAEGIRHLMMRDPKTGKFERITGDAKQIDKALKTTNAVWIYTKDPNVQAFTDLLNRCIDKPAEHVQVTGDGGPLVIRWQRDDDEPKRIEEKIIE